MPNRNPGEYLLFNVTGLPEKDLVGTAVVASLKEKYPERKIIITTHHPEVWLHNTDVHRVYQHGAVPYFYEDFVKNKDSLIFWQDPCNTNDYIQKKKPFAELWCDLCGVIWNKSRPKLHFTFREYEATKRMIGLEDTTFPVVMLQTESAAIPNIPHLWFRDMPLPIASSIVAAARRDGYRILHIRDQNRSALPDTESVNLNLRQTLCAISFGTRGIFVDSYAHHAAAAFNVPTTVFWITGDPHLKGYDFQENILPNFKNVPFKEFISSWSEQFNFKPIVVDPPYRFETLFSTDSVASSLQTTNEKK